MRQTPGIDATLAALEAADLRDSFRDFLAAAWPIMQPNVPFRASWHIDAICDHLQAVEAGRIKRLVINVPPRHGKSTSASVAWPAWSWTRRPWLRWLFASYTEGLVKRDSRGCRELILSPWYQQRWGDRVVLKRDQNQQLRYETTEQGVRIATTVGGANAGEGGDIIVVDDPHNFMEVYSQAHRERAINWWNTAMTTRLNDSETGAKVVIMQRVHQQDLCATLKDEGGWDWLVLPMEYRPKAMAETSIGFRDPRTQDGELLCPERFSPESVAAIRRSLGSYDAAAQLDQDPTPRGGSIIKDEWLVCHDGEPDGARDWLMSWDLAFKDFDTSSYVVGQVWCRKGSDYYLVHQVRDHLDVVQTIMAIERMVKQYPQCTKKLVEDKANGPAVIRLLKGKVPGLIAWPRKGRKMPSKDSRLYAVSPVFESGNVHIPRGRSWLPDYIDELTNFPQSRHDDQVDATSMALLEYTQGPRVVLESDLNNETD